MNKLKYSDLLICLDAGHAVSTSGKESPVIPELGYKIKEHSFNRAVVQKMILLCKKYGIKYVEVSDNPDKDISLNDRIIKINNAVKSNPSLKTVSISVHANSTGKPTLDSKNPSGMEVFYMSETNGSKELANCIYQEIKGGTVQKLRGVKKSDFALLKPKCASVLIEYLFMDSEGRLMYNDGYISECANETMDGILKFANITKQEPIAPKPIETIPTKEVIIVEQYKIEAVQWLIDNGFLTDTSWLEKADQPTPLYVDALITKRLYEKLK